ncbi:hypothetical protein V8G54_005158 [Vigna mungo]|uniref:Calcineurin-like phosphoesterase domain-containing protein n=1 Tax=Vigna mungo TaxID=3915 RepID=A0AAQ3SH38_VIGMU
MGVIGEQLNIDFVISTGDNFYDSGLTGIDDTAFDDSFTKIYTSSSLHKQWYSEVAEFFFVDTTPFVDKYFTQPGDHVYDWRGIHPRKNYISNLLKDVDLALRESNAKWKIVVGHHTIRSAVQHGDTAELVKQLLPILQANNIDIFINGHDHCLQHISSIDRGVVNRWKEEEMKLYYDGQGFMSVQLTQNEIYIVFYDVFGNVLHKWNTSKQLHGPS